MTRARWWCVSLVALCCGGLFPARAAAMPAVGLTTQGKLLLFDTDTPSIVQTVDVTGLQPGEHLVALDYRPATHRLYGMTLEGRMYQLLPTLGKAEWTGSIMFLPLDGVEFALDADPVNDVFRVISNTGQNFRVEPLLGVAIDTDENNPGKQPDTPLGPGNPDVRAAAYLHNFNGAPSTRLFVIDAATDHLRYTDAPNTGVLTDVGPLGVDVVQDVSFDIVGPTNLATMVIPQGAGSRMYSVDLVTGAATPGAIIGQGLASQRLIGFAIQWTGDVLRGVTADNHLVRFRSMTPGTIISNVAISGLQPGEVIVGLDFRPANPEANNAYALGSTGRLYRLTETGLATQVGLGTFAVPLAGSHFGFHFDPVADQIRIVSDAGVNFRVDPDSGLVIDSDQNTPGVQPDTAIAPGAALTALTYAIGATGALRHSLIGLDSNQRSVVRLGGIDGAPSPNTGTITTISSNLPGEAGTAAGFDWSARDNIGYASVIVSGQPVLVRVNTQSETLSLGTIGGGQPVLVLAVEPLSVFRLMPQYLYNQEPEDGGNSTLFVERANADDSTFITVKVTGGTAVHGVDFHLTERTLTFPAGDLGQAGSPLSSMTSRTSPARRWSTRSWRSILARWCWDRRPRPRSSATTTARSCRSRPSRSRHRRG
jgi:hypothetical protein